MSKVTPSDIDDIFGIPRDGSNIVDDDDTDAYAAGNKQTTKVSFDEKTKELVGETANTAIPTKENSSVEKKVEKPRSENIKDVEKSLKSVIPNASKPFDDLFGDDEDSTPTPKTETKKEEPKVVPQVVKVEETKVEVKESKPVEVEEKSVSQARSDERENDPKDQVESENAGTKAQTPPRTSSEPLNHSQTRKHVWKLESSSPKYAYFYKEKRDALEGMLLVGGELDFDKIYAELEQAHVDVSVGETFVADLICKKLEEVQRWRERIKQLQLQVNRQYFHWERAMDLFDGLLRRTEYDKFKQDGVMYEHMFDMEMYYSSLKMLHKSIETASRTLDGAFECLSRQVTVTMPMKEVSDRYSTGPRMSPQLAKFDGLQKHANGGSSITSAKPKEGPKGLEPTSGWPD